MKLTKEQTSAIYANAGSIEDNFHAFVGARIITITCIDNEFWFLEMFDNIDESNWVYWAHQVHEHSNVAICDRTWVSCERHESLNSALAAFSDMARNIL